MPIDLDRLRTGGAFGGALGRAAHAEQAPTRELQVGERVGAFRVERELSRGGMAIVYLAERADGEFTQRVALKWMGGTRDRDATEALFRRERDILAGLEHPGIARLIDGGRSHDGMLWFAMELVEGEAIDQWCERRALGLRARVGLVVALTEALAFAHARLLIHRDIKPGNVLVGNDGRVKLLDFGIARLADQHDLIGGFAMTPGYASPEQWSGDEITIASDVYQSGLLLAVLCGALEPAAGPRHVTRLDAVATGEPLALATQRLTRLPRDLGAIVRRATAIAPGNRYATVEALARICRRGSIVVRSLHARAACSTACAAGSRATRLRRPQACSRSLAWPRWDASWWSSATLPPSRPRAPPRKRCARARHSSS
jgi:eukaryotic-like serine/threonine-protein kinase